MGTYDVPDHVLAARDADVSRPGPCPGGPTADGEDRHNTHLMVT